MARVMLQSAAPILALLREVRETRRPFAKVAETDWAVRVQAWEERNEETEGELSRW
jgi:hypothetical protein